MSDERPEISLSYDVEPTPDGFTPSTTARDKFAATCGMVCVPSILACFISSFAATSPQHHAAAWNVSMLAGGAAFVSGVLGAMSAESVAARVMLLLGALAGPIIAFIMLTLSVVSH